ncbi:three-helix bundle dimerization domain-containing protein [Microbacterium sp. BWT-B31]|uniref:three-helix bundle dimerization domain-containing protein n=1 Tax=Microbacterium sp. BWT-B31 TaxID=3232072 RepID=UPI0035270BD7
MSATNPANEYEELVHIVERIARRFPEVAEAALFELVADVLTRYDGVRLRAYVPVLVEGEVLRVLRSRARDGSGVSVCL